MLHHRLRNVGILKDITKISHVITNDSSTITVMSGVQAGDLLVFFDCKMEYVTVIGSNVTPSGFTNIGTISTANEIRPTRISAHYKIANGTESGTTLTGLGHTFYTFKTLILFRGNKQISGVTSGSIVTNSTTVRESTISRTITSNSGSTPLIIFAESDDNSHNAVNVCTLNYTGETPITVNRTKYTIKNKGTTVNNVNISVTSNFDSYSTVLMGFYLELE